MINKTKTECETKLCQYDSLTRTRFYNGMLLTAEHLRAEQAYHRESLKRLNRNLFGSGIVCGLEVEIQPRGLCLTVHPGVALDCCGNLVEVCKCVTVDLSKVCKDEYGSQCLPPPDPQNPNQNVINRCLRRVTNARLPVRKPTVRLPRSGRVSALSFGIDVRVPKIIQSPTRACWKR
jgi:hypothetical protein